MAWSRTCTAARPRERSQSDEQPRRASAASSPAETLLIRISITTSNALAGGEVDNSSVSRRHAIASTFVRHRTGNTVIKSGDRVVQLVVKGQEMAVNVNFLQIWNDQIASTKGNRTDQADCSIDHCQTLRRRGSPYVPLE
jgi:hypothetical protein